MSLNAQSPIPLYRQLADRIRADIDAGTYAVDARIPSETVFAERLDIGRPTVRQATDLLVRQGRLERRRGSGTYVLPPSRSIDLFSLAGTSAALQKSELDARLELVSGPVRVSDPDEAPSDTTAAGDQARTEWLKIERRAVVAGVPVMTETLRCDAMLFAGLETESLADRSLSALVRDVLFLEPTSASQTFYAVLADATQATQLDVAEGAPLLHVHRELHFGSHRSALHADIICRTDHFEFTQTLYPAICEDTPTAGLQSQSKESLSA